MEIIRTRRYNRDLKRIGASHDEIGLLEAEIASDPSLGVIVPGLKGVRKFRFRLGNKGKRSGGRAIYYWMVLHGVIIMLTAYGKNDKADLDTKDRKDILDFLEDYTDE
jgi:hypothetical protein